MRRLAWLLVLPLVAGCGRDFTVPAAGKSAPAFLGPHAGFYSVAQPMDVMVNGKPARIEVPIGGHVAVQELPGEGGGPSTTVGVFLPDGISDLFGYAASLGPEDLITGGFTGQDLEANRSYDFGNAPVTGKAIPGGGGLSVSYTVCPGETVAPTALDLVRVCDFAPEISGVYSGGPGGQCAGNGASGVSAEALGFLPIDSYISIVAGVSYPDTGNLYVGAYDDYTGCGAMVRYDSTATARTGRFSLGSLTLADDGQTLTADLSWGSGAASPGVDMCGPVYSSCSGRFVGTRKTGTQVSTCSLGLPLGLTVGTSFSGALASRYLDVTVGAGGYGPIDGSVNKIGSGDDRTYLVGSLVPIGGTTSETQVTTSLPSGVSLRFDVPAHKNAPAGYTLTVLLMAPDPKTGQPTQIPFAAAMPRCVLEK